MKKALSCILTIALLITVMAPCLFLQAQETGTGLYDKVLEEDGFIYGVNLPWISQGDDGSTWAANAITGAASSFDETKLKKPCMTSGPSASPVSAFICSGGCRA